MNAQEAPVVVLHQEDGSFKEQSDMNPSKPIPIIEIPLGSHIQIELEAPEVVETECTKITIKKEWSFDNDLSSGWSNFLVQGEPTQSPDRSSGGYWDGSYNKNFTFPFDAIKEGQVALHFEKRTTSSDDNFKPHGYDNLYFDIHIINPQEFQD